MKFPFLTFTLALALLAITGGAQADNTKPAEKSKQAMDNVINAGAVKGSTTTSSGNNSDKAKPGDSAADFRPKQKPLKITEPPSPTK